VIVTSYSAFQQSAARGAGGSKLAASRKRTDVYVPPCLLNRTIDRIILDEGHQLRNGESTKAFRSIASIPASIKWVLSGTPLQNSDGDMLTLARWIGIDAMSVEGLKKYMLRRTQEQVTAQTSRVGLPPLETTVLKIPFRYPVEKALYDHAAALHTTLHTSLDKTSISMQGLLALRQICTCAVMWYERNADSVDSDDDMGSPRKRRRGRSMTITGRNSPIESPNPRPPLPLTPRAKSNLAQVARSMSAPPALDGASMLTTALATSPMTPADARTDSVPLDDIELDELFDHLIEERIVDERTIAPLPDASTPDEVQVEASDIDAEKMSIEHVRGKFTKLEVLCEQIEDQMNSREVNHLTGHRTKDEKSLVFCEWRTEMVAIQEMLKQRNIPSEIFAGNTPPHKKDLILINFRDGNVPVLIMQIKCGGTGLNLQAATRVYIVSPTWNPCQELQAIGRAYRQGQTKNVRVVRLVMEGTVEEKSVMEKQHVKAERISTVMEDTTIGRRLLGKDGDETINRTRIAREAAEKAKREAKRNRDATADMSSD
jgi:SNF2 family DNA or RNA helicase